MRISSKRIAELAGVSRGTVDRALHRRGDVNTKVAERILKIAEKHGYRPDPIGRALSTGKTHTIGVILFDLEHSFFSEVFTSIENRAREDSYLPFIALSHAEKGQEKKCIKRLAERGIDGLIIFPVNSSKGFISYIRGLDIPAVTFGNRLISSIPHIWIDEENAGADAAKHIREKGYSHILYYAPPLKKKGKSNIEAQEKRLSGVRKGSKSSGLVCTVVKDADRIADLIPKLDSGGKRTTILGATDEYALDCIDMCRSKGVVPGEKIGIMGFDNLNLLKYVTPAVVTLGYSREELGKKAFSMLLNMINNKKTEDNVIKHSIIHGQSL